MNDSSEPKRKPRTNSKPYDRAPRALKPTQPAHKSSAKPIESTRRSNLTLGDWLEVFKFYDSHPGIKQGNVVKHFATRREGALIFTQSALSKKLSARTVLEARVDSNPTALSSKRPRVVTRPDVERALLLWFHGMEDRGETVSGLMLGEKHHRFEKLFDVPEAECLTGTG
ncbi:hypothetical protein C8J56DRAFT_789658, partial [Mycena floridula]